MYKAVDVATHVLCFCSKKDVRITNLKLQKMLYFIWCDFYKETKTMLFEDSICAWQLGPVVPSVYYEYCLFGYHDIRLYGEPTIDEIALRSNADAQRIDRICERYIDISAHDLVELTHQTDTPWHETYRDGHGNHDQIPFDMIINSVRKA